MKLDKFKIVTQKRDNTCGYATAEMIFHFLEGQEISEDYLLENEPLDAMGITFSKLIEVYKKYLKNHRAEIVYGDRERMMKVITDSLATNAPLHILHLTENLRGNREPVLHYSALIGYDDVHESFFIADPYGSIKTLGKDDFFNAVSFRNEGLPEIVRQKYPSNMMIRFTV